jgi:hypothetical protein
VIYWRYSRYHTHASTPTQSAGDAL